MIGMCQVCNNKGDQTRASPKTALCWLHGFGVSFHLFASKHTFVSLQETTE